MTPIPAISILTLFITGAHGCISGTSLTVLKGSQPSILVLALIRDTAQADALPSFYGWTVTPVIGKLEDVDFLKQEATRADIIIQASGDNRDAVLAIMEGTTLSPKHNSEKTSEWPIFIQSSGASNVSLSVLGENSPRVWGDVDDWDELLGLEETRISVRTDNAIHKFSTEKGIHSLTLATAYYYRWRPRCRKNRDTSTHHL